MIKRKSYCRNADVYMFAAVNKNLRLAFPWDCPPAMGALIEQCWSLKPEKRPEF
ncbi:unnamed protein product [Ilex paraguariensis]|uniref:Serine-threonine/tyrosine-protein kinase catalytic domain-containing protein n=1 Tax=Ilex paraguariensis TaxID=185542 RepID=A0ABC8V2H4_9AQUA